MCSNTLDISLDGVALAFKRDETVSLSVKIKMCPFEKTRFRKVWSKFNGRQQM